MKIVELKNETPVTTSLIISRCTNIEHSSIIKLIRNHLKDLEKFGTCRFEIQKTKGRPLEFAYLNEQQTTLLITFMRNSEIVVDFKIKLVEEFYKMKKTLMTIIERRKDEEWINGRKIGKITRQEETDTIKEFVEYAKSQGSTKAEMYYQNISKMENKGLFLIEEKFKNIREVLTGQQLQVLCSADQIVINALKDGMKNKMNYKEIYTLAKERIEVFASIIPKSIVPMINKIKYEGE